MNPDDRRVRELVNSCIPTPSVSEMEVRCARVLDELRSKQPLRPKTHVIESDRSMSRSRQLRILLPVAASLLLAFFVILRQPSPLAAVENVGGMYRMKNGTVQAMRVGETLFPGEIVRAEDGTGTLKLADGSRVEMRSRSELRLDGPADGVRIHLTEGSVIVNATRQPAGQHLVVQTKDLSVSVEGTVFVVNAEESGSRVAVIEGEVRVEQGKTDQKLISGEQVSTAAGMKSLSVKEEVSWSRNVEEHLALLQQSATSTRQEPGKSRPAFEVASVRPSRNVLPKGGAGRGGFLEGCSGNPIELDPGRFTALNTTLPTMISLAYSEIRLSAKNYALDCATLNMLNLLSGGPDWIKSVEAGQFDIQAVIPAGAPRYKMSDLLGGNAPALQQMLQALLEDRFKLVLRRETKEIPVYFLSVSKSGPKFNGSRQELSRDGKPRVHIREDDSGNLVRSTESSQGIRFGRSQDQNGSTYIRLDANRTPMSELVLALHRPSGRFVIDRTGLMGEYTFYLDYSENGVGRPPVTSVLQEIGLELKDGRAPVEVWNINHVEKPSEN